MTRPARTSTVIALVLALGLGGCAGDDDAGEATAPAASDTDQTTGAGTDTDTQTATGGLTEGLRVVAELGPHDLVFTPESPVFACDADRGEADVQAEDDDGATVTVRVPAASMRQDIVIEVTLSDGTTWVGADPSPDVLLTDGTLVLSADLVEEGGTATELLELMAVCR